MLSAHGEFVVKLDVARMAALVAQDQGSPFTMGGRAMREWLVVVGESLAQWRCSRARSAGPRPRNGRRLNRLFLRNGPMQPLPPCRSHAHVHTV